MRYIEALGRVRIEPFDHYDGAPPDWLSLNFDASTDTDGHGWGDIDSDAWHDVRSVAADYEELADALRSFGIAVAQAMTDMLVHGESFVEVGSPDETGGMTIDELIPGIDAQLAEWRKVRDE